MYPVINFRKKFYVTVKFTIYSTPIAKLRKAKEQSASSRRLSTFVRPLLLIIDEVSSKSLDDEEAALLFDAICRCYEYDSNILTSNKTYSGWANIFSGNEAIATVILDRLLHHLKSFALNGSSYRKKEFKAKEEG